MISLQIYDFDVFPAWNNNMYIYIMHSSKYNFTASNIIISTTNLISQDIWDQLKSRNTTLKQDISYQDFCNNSVFLIIFQFRLISFFHLINQQILFKFSDLRGISWF